MHDLPAQIDLEEAISGATSGPFNYAQLSRRDEALARSDAQLIRAHSADIARKGVEIGRALIRQKAALPHGLFTSWIESECALTYDVAARMMRLAQAVEANLVSDQALNTLSCKALDLLVSDKTSPKVRDEVEARVIAGEAMTADDVRRLREAEATIDQLSAASEAKIAALEKAKAKSDRELASLRDKAAALSALVAVKGADQQAAVAAQAEPRPNDEQPARPATASSSAKPVSMSGDEAAQAVDVDVVRSIVKAVSQLARVSIDPTAFWGTLDQDGRRVAVRLATLNARAVLDQILSVAEDPPDAREK